MVPAPHGSCSETRGPAQLCRLLWAPFAWNPCKVFCPEGRTSYLLSPYCASDTVLGVCAGPHLAPPPFSSCSGPQEASLAGLYQQAPLPLASGWVQPSGNAREAGVLLLWLAPCGALWAGGIPPLKAIISPQSPLPGNLSVTPCHF